MSMDYLLTQGVPVKRGADGWMPFRNIAEFPQDLCCSDPLCIDEVTMSCAFIDLLPSGPLWDRQKSEAREAIIENGGIPDGTSDIFSCPSMVTYTVYVSQVLHDMVQNVLTPSVRESQPYTASSSLDDWLERLGWVDCYRSNCRSLFAGKQSPYERPIEDCPGQTEYCPAEFDPEFERAMKHAIIQSLERSRRGVIRNIEGLNWIIAPLGVELRLPTVFPEPVQDWLDGNCETEDGGIPCWCLEAKLELHRIVDVLPCAPGDICESSSCTVPYEQLYVCEGLEDQIVCPALIAAECIVASIIPR